MLEQNKSIKTLYAPAEQKKIGMLTPSSNTALEPICSKMVSGLEDVVTMHYARFCVKEISLNEGALAQFNLDPMLKAAEQLADADVDVIAWNGTSGGWLGFENDYRLCEKIQNEFGIPATTSMLAQLETLKADNAKNINMITPYIPEINALICKQYKEQGFNVISERGMNKCTVNRSFSQITKEEIFEMCDEVFKEEADALSVVCTNMNAIKYVQAIEQKYGVTMHDTINVIVWKTLKLCGINPSIVQNWGGVFQL